MKDCDSRRSWIGGEGLPSRDLGQRREREKLYNKKDQFSRRQCRYSGTGLSYVSFSACMWVSVEIAHITWVLV
jgi:hypothetical protein